MYFIACSNYYIAKGDTVILRNYKFRRAANKYATNKQKDLTTEFGYQLFEQEETIRRVKLEKENDQMQQIATSIFPCQKGDITVAVPSK